MSSRSWRFKKGKRSGNMQLSDREKITSRTSENNQRARMYVSRQTNNKQNQKSKQISNDSWKFKGGGGEGTWRSSSTMQQQQQEGESQRENHLTNFFFSPSTVWRLVTGPLESWNMFRSSRLSSALLDDDDAERRCLVTTTTTASFFFPKPLLAY
jgi:hypothetical protein